MGYAVMKKVFLGLDFGLVVPAIVLVILSLTTLFSLNITLFRNQLVFFIISIFTFLFFSQANYKIIQKYSLPIYIISIILLILVLGVGIETRGSVRWFEILGFRIQFSEILKPFLAISLSAFLSSRQNNSYKTFFLTIAILSPIAFLIFMQPDLGNALIYLLAVTLTLFVYGFPLRLFLISIFFAGALAPFVWQFLRGYQRQRIITFFHNNSADPLGFSYNAIQSIIAIGSGMIIGRGLGQGTQSHLKFLPEKHTDFIFSTLSENLGFIGSLIVLLAFAFLLHRIFIIFSNHDETFPKLFGIIAFSVVFMQFFINVGMNTGILPIVGVTLPFVSYGGSSLLSSFIFLGLLSSFKNKSLKGEVLEIK